jgi:hypothetical protein
MVDRHCVGFPGVALWASVLLAACSASTPSSTGSVGGGGSSGGASSGVGSSSGAGSSSGTASSSGPGSSSSGAGSSSGAAGSSSSGGAGSSSSGGGSSGGAGSSSSGGGSSGGAGSSSGAVTVPATVELIGPTAATCGATNATHGDGFVCVLNYPSAGPNAVGYWFDYPFSAGTCTVSFTKPASNTAANPQVCFSGSACAATSGGGLGVALCDTHGIDVSTWPQLMMLETTSSLSSTAKSPISGCDPGAAVASVSWTVASGSIPPGTSVLFDDVSDVDLAVASLAAGATSATVPANVDASKVASIKLSVNGASSTSWSFCLSSVKVSLH